MVIAKSDYYHKVIIEFIECSLYLEGKAVLTSEMYWATAFEDLNNVEVS